MLKLLKYEWKACARVCLPLYGAMVLLSIINNLMMAAPMQRIMYGIPTAVTTMLNFGVLVASLVITTVILIQRFYKSLLGDEGYLMFTLPVTVSQHIWSKLIVAHIMSFLSVIAAYLSIAITGAGLDVFRWIGNMIEDRIEFIAYDPQILLVALEVIVLMILLSVMGLLFIYLCISLGHLARKHRVLMSVVWYFALTTAFQFIFMMLFYWIGEMQSMEMWYAFTRFLMDIGPQTATHIGLITMCLLSIIPCVACFLGVRYILTHKLNLE